MALGDIFGKLGFGSGSSNATVDLKIPDGMQLVPIGTTVQTPGTVQNTTLPGTQATSDGKGPAAFPAAATGDQSPLANYADLFKIDDKDRATAPGSIVPEIKFDQKATIDRLSTIDYTKHINDAAKEAARNGDLGPAIAQILPYALTGVMGYTNSQLTSITKSMENKLLNEILPAKLREYSISNQVVQDNPIFDNPAVAPMLEIAKSQLQAKYPEASAAEISSKAKDYLLGMSTEIAKSQGMSISKMATTTGADGSNIRGKLTDFTDWA